jgi:hypothetical protein
MNAKTYPRQVRHVRHPAGTLSDLIGSRAAMLILVGTY